MRRRARELSEQERAFWHAWVAATHVQPLKGRAPLPVPAMAEPAPAPAPAALPPAPPVPKPRAAPLAELRIGASPGGLDAKSWQQLRRGKLRPERTLDLHGRRVHEAHLAVRAFLQDAYADGVRCVTIVTGKGPAPEGGVLRRELPMWLNAPELRHLLLGAAHPHAANAGSVNLLLRRKRVA